MSTHNARVCGFILVVMLSAVHGPAQTQARPLPGDRTLEEFPDSSELRKKYWNEFFMLSRERLATTKPRTVRNAQGEFRLSFLEEPRYFFTILTAMRSPAAANQADAALYSQGSWILKRARGTGEVVQAKVFLRSDPGCFIRVYPDKERSRLDLVLYGGVMARKVAIPLPFERVFAASLSEIRGWTQDLVDWDMVSPRPGQYRVLRDFLASLRQKLPELRYAEDGAMDASGNPVFIASGQPQPQPAGLNCSGFAKWVVDGLYRPIGGGLLDIRAMAMPHEDDRKSSFSAPFEKSLDPYFGLDWTRNLAKALGDALYPGRPRSIGQADVTETFFALFAPSDNEARMLENRGAINGQQLYETYPAYSPDLGYEARGLRPLLYALALKDPGAMYLASLSRKGGNAAKLLRSHYHVALIAPYIEESGEFCIAVFESAAETSIEGLIRRAPFDYVHLVRIPALREFDPPPLR